MQGGIDPELPGTFYFDLRRRGEGRGARHARARVQPDGGRERRHRTRLSFEEFLTEASEAGLDTIPGTAAEILDDEVRWVLTKGKLPGRHLGSRSSRTAHGLGIRSSARR